MNNIIAIILARKGSKELKNKNIRLLGGKPLIYYSIFLLKKINLIRNIYVSTDCKKIAKIAKKFGAEVPFLRPKKFSKDNTTTEDALKYTLARIVKLKFSKPTVVVYTQVTEPFKSSRVILDCINLFLKKKFDTVFAAKPFKKNIWRKYNGNFSRLNIFEKYGLPRQKKKSLFREDTGVVCVTKAEFILKGKRIGRKLGIIEYENDFDYIDIHNKNDLIIANEILKKKLFKIY